MPVAVRKSRTGLPRAQGEQMNFTWTTELVKKLLKLIKDRPECRMAFFPTGIIKRFTKHGQARVLLLELVKNEPDYLQWLKLKGLIKRDERNRWIPLDSWTSDAINNPVVTQMRSLKIKYAEAYKERAIELTWTTFDDLPRGVRTDFKMEYPWFFQWKELTDPSQAFQRPPVTLSSNRLDHDRASATPAPPPPTARSRQRLPPSPSPSDRSSSASSSSSSPSPSPSRSPSPVPSPSPPHVASLLRMSLTPRPNLDIQRSSSASVVPSGPRPHLRPNAVASSSRIPIRFESSSSSSSGSAASDIHMWGEPGSEVKPDSESEHEMENDTPTIRGSVVPSRLPTPATLVASRKRPYESDSVPQPKRCKDHQRVQKIKREPAELSGPSRNKQSVTAHEVKVERVPISNGLLINVMPDDSALADTSESVEAGNETSHLEQHPPDHINLPDIADDEARDERRDILMARLRGTVAADAPRSIEDVPQSCSTRKKYVEAETPEAKLEIFRNYQTAICRNTLCHLHRHGSLPLCLKDCRLWFDADMKHHRYKKWLEMAMLAGAKSCSGEQELFAGQRQSIRIRISTALSGLTTEPRLQGPGDEGTRFRAHQYSFLAFGRFFYNRICRCIDSDYPPLPASATATATSIPRQVVASSSSGLRHAAEPAVIRTPLDAATAEVDGTGEASLRDEDEVPGTSEPRSEFKARLMNKLRASVTPHQDPTSEPEIFAARMTKNRPEYLAAPDQDAKEQVLWTTQYRTATLALHILRRSGMLSRCLEGYKVWIGPSQIHGLSNNIRNALKEAGGVSCFGEEDLAAGDPNEIRLLVRASLSGYEIGSVVSAGEAGNRVRIRHYSFLAFLRFFFERLRDAETSS